MTGPEPLLGGVELGGTKCICCVGTAHRSAAHCGRLIARFRDAHA